MRHVLEFLAIYFRKEDDLGPNRGKIAHTYFYQWKPS